MSQLYVEFTYTRTHIYIQTHLAGIADSHASKSMHKYINMFYMLTQAPLRYSCHFVVASRKFWRLTGRMLAKEKLFVFEKYDFDFQHHAK